MDQVHGCEGGGGGGGGQSIGDGGGGGGPYANKSLARKMLV